MKVCAIGNITLDIIVSSISDMPAWGTEVFVDEIQPRLAGNLVNFALPLKKLGVDCRLLGNVGDDRIGADAIETLSKEGFDTDTIRIESGMPTSSSIGLIRKDGQRSFLTIPGQLTCIDREFLEACTELIPRDALVAICNISQLPALGIPELKEYLRKLRKQGCLIMADPGWDPEGWRQLTIDQFIDLMPLLDLFLPNLDEAAAISGHTHEKDILSFFAETGVGNTILTMGEKGCAALIDGSRYRQSALSCIPADSTGAGDAFAAGVAYGLVYNLPPLEMLKLATALAGFVVSYRRERYPSLDQLSTLIEQLD